MLAWFGELNAKERRTMGACFGGWALDAFDVQMYSFVIPTIIALWGLSRGEAGLIGTVTLLISSLGGWFSGTLADRFGRVRMLQITILWYSVFTFLCAFAQNFEQLFILRAMHGFGFGGEWAAGAVLMGEVIRDKYRGRGVGLGADRLGRRLGRLGAGLYRALCCCCPRRSPGGRCSRSAWSRRSLSSGSAGTSTSRRFSTTSSASARRSASAHLFSAFRSPHLWTTVKVSLMVAGAQGGGYALGIWMPTYLRTVRHLSATSTGGFLLVQIFGALLGFLLGAYLSDAIGRKWTFMWSAIGSRSSGSCSSCSCRWATRRCSFFGIPLNVVLLMKFPPMGPFMTELYPTSVRGTAQGFCYNAGRAIGSFFPTMVGFLSQVMPLGTAIAVFSAIAFGLMIVMLLLLPETRGRSLASLEPEPSRLPGAAQ